METTATFDHNRDEFVIRTPTTLAQKYWITNSAIHAKWAVVFAQMIIGQTNHGIHGFLVRIRNEVYPIRLCMAASSASASASMIEGAGGGYLKLLRGLAAEKIILERAKGKFYPSEIWLLTNFLLVMHGFKASHCCARYCKLLSEAQISCLVYCKPDLMSGVKLHLAVCHVRD